MAIKIIPQKIKGIYEYYNSAAIKYKRISFRLVIIEIVVSAMIPFLALLMMDYNSPILNYIVSLLGVVLVIITSIKVFNYDKLSQIYRRTAENVWYEIVRFENGAAPYDSPDHPINLNKLIDRIEKISEQEMIIWNSIN